MVAALLVTRRSRPSHNDVAGQLRDLLTASKSSSAR
jgi:hypothetical protein